MSDNGQVLSIQLQSWNHSHNCYVCKKHYDCTWMFCKDQLNRCCSECIAHFEEQAKGVK